MVTVARCQAPAVGYGLGDVWLLADSLMIWRSAYHQATAFQLRWTGVKSRFFLIVAGKLFETISRGASARFGGGILLAKRKNGKMMVHDFGWGLMVCWCRRKQEQQLKRVIG